MAELARNLRLTIASLAVLATVAACGGNSQCDDGVDNDSDGLIDSLDPGCAVNGDAEFPEPPQCADGVDNDSDGIIDTADPGCQGADDDDEYNDPVAQCRDGLDNDSDGFIDFPNDPGCSLSLDADEGDSCPDGTDCPACGNGVDDDGDGLADYPEDPGCNNAGDNDEFNADPTICGASVPVMLLPASGIAEGTFNPQGSNDLISLDCGGSGTEVAFEFTLDSETALNITTDFPETTADTVIYLRSMCRIQDTELGCSDDEGGSPTSSMLIENVPAGTYYLVVDSVDSTGDFKVAVSGFSPLGGSCDPMDFAPCPPGLVCRSVSGSPTCEVPECEDSVDDDGDGDGGGYPIDPGCASAVDNDESDDCDLPFASQTNCPQCSNGVDDDGDGLIDNGQDLGCKSAGDDLELECEAESDPVTQITAATLTGNTTGATNDLAGSCSFGGTAPDLVYTLSVPGDLATLTVDTEGSSLDTLLYIRADDCSAADLDCDDEGGDSFGTSKIVLSDVAAGIYLVVVDGYSSNQGAFTLNVRGEIKAGQSCSPAAEAAGYLVCADGFACAGSSGSEFCQPAQCSNGTDDDSDGFLDWPNDPGCSSASDALENDEASGCNALGKPQCPACSNGSDDDGDGLVDFGADPGCAANGDNDETDECIAGVPATVLTGAGASGTTQPLSAGSNFKGSCNSANSPEDVYVLRVEPPGLNFLTVTTSTMSSSDDTVLYVRKDECGDDGAEVACKNQVSGGESVTIAPADPGFYYIFVDGNYDSGIAYNLAVSGSIPFGGACVPGDPSFTCGIGLVCSSNVCSAP